MYTGTLLDFLNMGGSEIMLILLAVLLLFGGKKLPELARGLGKGIRDFKDASEGVKREIHRNINSIDLEKEINMDTTTYPSVNNTVPVNQSAAVDQTETAEPVTTAEHTEENKPNSNI